MEHNEILTKEGMMEREVRDIIKQIVIICLEAMKLAVQSKSLGVDFVNAAEEMEDAILALYDVETAMGNAHQYLLVANATIDAESENKA